MQDIKGEIIVDKYINWIKESFDSMLLNGSSLIKTPYMKPDGDFIEVKLFTQKDKLFLTDDGGTFDYLFLSGIDLYSDNTNRDNMVSRILASNNVSFINNIEIGTEINGPEQAGDALYRLLRAINALNYLIYTTRPSGIRYFKENVSGYLDFKQIRYEMDYNIQGKARLHKFDFYINHKKPYIIKTLSTENLSWARRLATETMFDFVDTKQLHPEYQGIAFLDDKRQGIWDGDAIAILKNYSDYVIGWNNRDELEQILA